eukprot:3680606-Alexandrium_andersonii.AAC.1
MAEWLMPRVLSWECMPLQIGTAALTRRAFGPKCPEECVCMRVCALNLACNPCCEQNGQPQINQ